MRTSTSVVLNEKGRKQWGWGGEGLEKQQVGKIVNSPFLGWGGIRKELVHNVILLSGICLSLKDIVKQLPNLFILWAILQ